MFYVYVLESLLSHSLYVGSTNDLKRRFKNHNDGKVFSTKRYKPWKLIYYEAYYEEELARLREQKLKQHGNSMKHLKNRIIKKVQKSSGFSLIELVISTGILLVLIGVLTTLFGQILDVQLESKATSSVDQNGRFIMARLTHDLQSASAIITPVSPGNQTNTLQITISGTPSVYSLDSNGNLLLTRNSQSDQLNSEAVTISGLSLTRIGNGDIHDTVRIGFTVKSKTRQTGGFEQKNFQTTLGLD